MVSRVEVRASAAKAPHARTAHREERVWIAVMSVMVKGIQMRAWVRRGWVVRGVQQRTAWVV